MFIGWRKPPIIVSDTVRTYVLYVRTLRALSRTAKCYFVSHSLTYYNPRRWSWSFLRCWSATLWLTNRGLSRRSNVITQASAQIAWLLYRWAIHSSECGLSRIHSSRVRSVIFSWMYHSTESVSRTPRRCSTTASCDRNSCRAKLRFALQLEVSLATDYNLDFEKSSLREFLHAFVVMHRNIAY
jgi:hypothetical protein